MESLEVNVVGRMQNVFVNYGTERSLTILIAHNSPIFLISSLQGSAATPCYTVLYDSLNLSMDALETMTFGLAHLHQICTMTTSLPAPLYIATQYTKRGSTLLSEKM